MSFLARFVGCRWCLLAGLLTLSVAGLRAVELTLDDGWRFHRGDTPGAAAPDFPDADWTRVTLPDPAGLEARVTDHGAHQQWEGVCWYRRTLTLPASAAGQVVWVRFEGAMNRAELYANGEKIAASVDGYLPLVGDLTRFARTPGPLTLAVRLDNDATEETGPKPLAQLDFHLYHGLYRTASLVIKPPLHITDEILADAPASGGIFVTYPEVTDSAATVAVQVHVRNSAAAPADFSLVLRLTDATGREVARAETPGAPLAAGASEARTAQLHVAAPKLWSPPAPNLHTLEVALVDAAGRTIDAQQVRVGLRRFSLEPGGVVINGRKQFLDGTNRHQEYPYVGNALPAAAQYRDALKIKEAGFDFIRLSHYPQSPDFLAACDELGLVVMDSILGWQWDNGTPAFHANRLAASRQLVRRDRNHPCVLFWEVALNETDMADDFIHALHAAAHAEFPGDQMATAGWKRGYDVYVKARQHGSTEAFAHATFPALVSEYGDWEYYAGNAGFNQESWGDLKEDARNSRQTRGDGEVRMLQQALNFQQAHNENRGTQAMGDATWVMFDYNRGYAEDLETSGMMDLFRLPKFVAWFFASQRDPAERFAGGHGGPMVFAATWWTEASPLAVRVFSNCDEVELALNGRSLGRRKPDTAPFADHLAHPPFTFHVASFEPGELRATGYIGGRAVAEHVVRTPGAPVKLAVALDLDGRPLARDGDLVIVHARVLDAAGTVVPAAKLPVTFAVSGDAVLIGENPIAAEAGIASILVKTPTGGGAFHLTARADGLAAGEVDGAPAN